MAFCWFQPKPKPRELEALAPPTVSVLMEVVSASGLVPPGLVTDLKSRRNVTEQALQAKVDKAASGLDPYCVICVQEERVHQTKVIWNDPDPVWTVKTDSLCIVEIPENEANDKDNPEESSVIVEVCHGNQCLGVVAVPFEHVLASKGERQEFPICVGLKARNRQEDLGVLALRFRLATSNDISFFDQNNSPKRSSEEPGSRAGDIHFKRVNKPGLMQHRSRKQHSAEKLFRVQPGCDPERVEETTWMTKDAISEESLKPSRKWVEAGYGTMGIVHVEIVGCDDLPNMDVGVNDKTDPFVGIVFEDNMVRTCIIHDSLSPRWMPWSTRAFAFHITHPSSLLLLGVFDYDEGPLHDHDPVGRVVINMTNFESNTSYLLHYPLHDDPQENDNRGRITVRLRVEWRDEREAMKQAALTTPSRFLINVESNKSFKVLRYICRGKINMEKASMATVKIYANELVSHFKAYLYVIDVLVGVLLWRGRIKVFGHFSVWFPIQSIALFLAASLAVEKPTLIPAIFFYGIAWIMLSINYHVCQFPNPWKRCKSARKRVMVRLFGSKGPSPVTIEPNEGVEQGEALEALDRVKSERVAGFLQDSKTVALKAKKIYSKSQVNNIAIETEDKKALFSFSFIEDNLTYLHLMLYMMCTNIRMLRNLVTWRSYSSNRLTLLCLTLGTLYSFPRLFIPMDHVLLWVARVVVWIVFGPGIKLVDILYIHPYYRTREELMADPEFHGTNLEAALESDSIKELGKAARIAAEDARKLKDMREHKFGKWSELVPSHDTSRFPSTPLPTSTAQPYLGTFSLHKHGFVDVQHKTWKFVQGQKLFGAMIHERKPPRLLLSDREPTYVDSDI